VLLTLNSHPLSLPYLPCCHCFVFLHFQFTLFANSMEASLRHHAENLEESVRNIGDTVTASSSSPGEPFQPFPFVDVRQFETHGEHARARSKMEAITYAPLVTSSERVEWEDFTVANQNWIENSRATFLDHSDVAPVYLPGRISPFIYRRRDGVFTEPVPDERNETYAPIWYLSPPPFNPAIVNFDLLSNPQYQALANKAITSKNQAFSPVTNVEPFSSLQVSDADHLHYHEQFTSVSEGIGYGQPHSLYAQPVFESNRNEIVVGVLLGSVAWDAFLADLLPKGVNGIILILHSTCGEDKTYTYELNGIEVSLKHIQQ